MSENPWSAFRSDVLESLKKAFDGLDWPKQGLADSLEEPPDPSFGDLATTICFELPEELKNSPRNLAQKLSTNIEAVGLVEKIESVGGYVNFFVSMTKLASLTIKQIEDSMEKYGKFEVDGDKIVVEHTSVNPTKPLHVGHGRNAVIGDTMSRILKACGYEVEVQNYIDDLGLQVAQTFVAYQKEENRPNEKFDHFLGKLYVKYHEKMKSDLELDREAREMLSKLEEGGSLAQRAREMALKCVESNLDTTDRLNIDYDLLVWESDISRTGMLEKTLARLEKTPYLVEGEGEHEGAKVLRLEDFGLEDKVMVRSDGTAVYTARDLAYQLWKFGEIDVDLHFDLHSERPSGVKTYTTVLGSEPDIEFASANQVINVIGVEQKYPQKVVFAALKALGLGKEYENSHHMAYEHVRLPSRKFKGREGTWIGYSVDDVLDEAISRAKKEVEKRNPDAGEEFVDEAAKAVGIGAFRYSLISTSPEKEVVFKWGEALNFERNSGPAIQYSHARASSIFKKADEQPKDLGLSWFEEDETEKLIKKLAKFPETVKEAGENRQPHMVASYASELALSFNKFYEKAPVLQAETKELKSARLRLVKCVKRVLANSLALLGIEAPERM